MNYIEFIEKQKAKPKKKSWVDINRKGKHTFEREACTYMVQSNCEDKVFVLERLRILENDGPLSYPETATVGSQHYRLGYYIVGKIGKRVGVWTWGQFCPILPPNDLFKLINLAKEEGTILPEHEHTI